VRVLLGLNYFCVAYNMTFYVPTNGTACENTCWPSIACSEEATKATLRLNLGLQVGYFQVLNVSSKKIPEH